MKKTLFAISAIAVLLGFTACTSENETLEPQASKTITIKAYTEENTRTTLDGNDTEGYKVFWSKNDAIKIGENTFTLTTGEGTTSGTFEGDELTDGDYTAYYPADYDGTNWPTAQTYTEGNITGSPMKATFTYTKDVEPSLAFKNEGGILRLNLKLSEGDAARSVKKIVVSSGQLADDIALNCETPVALTKDGVPFHIAVPAKTYTNLKFTIYDAEGNKCIRSLKSSKPMKLNLSQISPVNLTASNFQAPNYLCFTAEEAGASVGMYVNNTPDHLPTLEYSTDLSTWTTFTPGTSEAIALANVGDKVYFRGNNPEGFNKDDTYNFNYVKFTTNGTVAASGNVMSLIDPTCQATTIPCAYCFYYLFNGCASLTSAPELPATTLANYCYKAMFYKCTSLTTAPELPATTLAEGCYCQMFRGDGEMTSAPELPAETLANMCYQAMFSYCTKLNSVTCLATDISTMNVGMGLSDAGTGTLYCAPGMVDAWKNSDEVPSGWTVEAPAPATRGKATRTGNVEVNWVQLWENGPKFAEYNVGATSETEYGGYYCWGKSVDQENPGTCNTGSVELTGDNDTATKLWGSNWRMPTKAEFDNLLANCTAQWVTNYKNTGVNGRLFTGKGAYAANSVFFPATASCNDGNVLTGNWGNYWSSTPSTVLRDGKITAEYLYSPSHKDAYTEPYDRTRGFSVRAVLK